MVLPSPPGIDNVAWAACILPETCLQLVCLVQPSPLDRVYCLRSRPHL